VKIKELSDVFIAAVRDYVQRQTDPISTRLAALEARPVGMSWAGVWQENKNYDVGCCVTIGGNVWHCNNALTSARPGASSDWTLIAKPK